MNADGKIDPLVVAAIASVLTLALFGYLYLQPSPPAQKPLPTLAATLLPELRPLAPFSLLDQQSRPYDNQRLQGHWTLLSFGYTHCPDTCPTTLATLTQMKQHLQLNGMQAPYVIGFVSIDPERDTPQRLAEYVSYFDPEFLGITGTPAALKALTAPLGILYRKVVTEESAMDYVMDHSASIILLDPLGRYYALFSPPHDAAIMARDMLAISKNQKE
jgi:protein SCO1/2